MNEDPRVIYRPKTEEIPTAPGVYRFFDEYERVIYVGKAKNIRNRLQNYFQPIQHLHPRTYGMVTTARRVAWTVVSSELEAIALEYTWIKEFSPYFNVMFRDDKSYPYIAVSMKEKWPRVFSTRAKHKSGNKYFGPYAQAWAVRETLQAIISVYPLRRCSNGEFNRAIRQKRACISGYIGRCAAPCVGKISNDAYLQMATNLCRFLAGSDDSVVDRIADSMKTAAADLDFEIAAKYRDQLQAIQKVLEKNTVVLEPTANLDVLALAFDDLEVSVQVFYVRSGRIRGQRGWIAHNRVDGEISDLVAAAIEQIYGEKITKQELQFKRKDAVSVDDQQHFDIEAIPGQILVPELPTDVDLYQGWINAAVGRQVNIRVPQRGDKHKLLETVARNAKEAIVLHKSRRIHDLTARGQAIEELANYIEIENHPLRIEGFDISHTQGFEQVASMVVFEDGIPRKNQYRHFVIKGEVNSDILKADDTAAMREVLTRRFKRIREEEKSNTKTSEENTFRDENGRLKRFSYRPDLVVVDGGIPQVNAARKTLDELGYKDIEVVGIAKRLEEVWHPKQKYPYILPRTSQGIFILQNLRDESHRFAIAHHRKRRSKAMTKTVLSEINGLGPQKQKALIKKFGSVKQIRLATVEEIATVSGISLGIAERVKEFLIANEKAPKIE